MKRGLRGWTLCAAVALLCISPAQTVQAAITGNSLVVLANTDRARAGVGLLSSDPLLARAAQAKADDMAAQGYFSHVEPDGAPPWHWFSAAGYYYTSAGENLAINFNNAQSLESAWMQSPAHRANLLRDKYTRVGIGISRGTYQDKPATFVVEFFANPATIARS